MNSSTRDDGQDAQGRPNEFWIFLLQDLACGHFGKIPNSLEIVSTQPFRNIRIMAAIPSQIDDSSNCVRIPVAHAGLPIDSDEMRNGRV